VILERSRTLAAAPEAVWAVVRDPRALPQWWPRTERVESVRPDAWTTVMRSERGRIVRADWRLDGQDKLVRRTWSQKVDGTPFARVLRGRRVEARLAADGARTRVVLQMELDPRRRVGGLLLRGGARRELDAALAGLARAVEDAG
jgi:uncharacterized protein YndB with AHSA1/START domain